MNPPRRTMAAALIPTGLTPETLSIIQEGSPKPQTQLPVLAGAAQAKLEEEATPKPNLEAQKPAKVRAEKERQEASTLIAVNYRIPSNISQELLRASSERKLKKIRPYTQQEIVAEALSAWLQKNG